MIITITCNPAIDKTVYENNTVFDIGGKGINVSKVLKKLNTNTIATGFIGKENKDLVIANLNDLEIQNNFIEVDGYVRTNTKRIVNGNLIEENQDGPCINSDNINDLFYYLKDFSNEIVVISGSAPSSADRHIYKNMIDFLKENNNYVILDCDKDLFKYAIEAKPNVIKPNKEEICKYFNIEYDEKEIINRCKKLDIDLICLSLGSEGALFIADDVYRCKPLDIKVSSTVGAGDAMVGAIAYSKYNNFNTMDMIRLAMAASAASCTTEGTKPAELETINSLINKVKIDII